MGEKIIVIGAGIGGLSAAANLAARGCEVIVLEKADAPGGKIRTVEVDGAHIDAGPTLFTMRWVFDELFTSAGDCFADHVTLKKSQIIARHAWSADERLDLFADMTRSVEAIGAFAGAAEARRYAAFCAESQHIYATLEKDFIRAQRPSPAGLVGRAGLSGLADLAGIHPFATMWSRLGAYFHDPRLRQLFGRYATYCGSSPFLAPATLMLIAHVERDGIFLVEGGMHALARALSGLAVRRGAEFRYGAEARRILIRNGCAAGVVLSTGETIEASAVIVNADVAALASGLFGAEAAVAASPAPRAQRSLSAVTWMLNAPASGFPLVRHNVFFSNDYAAEFDALFRRGRTPFQPTVYICAQDRDDCGAAPGGEGSLPERLLILINAPATGDSDPFDAAEIDQCRRRVFALLNQCGLEIGHSANSTATATPRDFETLFPATGGALYGRASHGWMASFQRPGSRSKIPGLYLAGGSAHPGPGVPMAALSGRLAAQSLIADRLSTRRFRRAATPGATLTR
ncbi:1-hydroxycarotenoid 3,4-desaturase CrtD [Methylocella silvestris]|uniref:CrtD protein n=1 Tax=Methylocella silvestris TaxID=199596 RepID=A0A2J7TDF5_METSI|nr:1-hydroxycarotenoid 3,4-desaturase CrtD [Methylocella silvestris]PNG24790.1 CrtD protein [Methylocella silvestris]